MTYSSWRSSRVQRQFPHYTNPPRESRLTTRPWFGGIVLPEDEGKNIYPEQPKQHAERRYFFDIDDDGTWCWREKDASRLYTSPEVAERAVNELLDLHEGVKSGRIRFPELPF